MIWVVGAVAIDMIAVREKFLDGTSNPSDIHLGLGGVGYRIFSNLEAPRRFITALGSDPISRWAQEALLADGDVILQEEKGRDAGPPLYLALMESGSLKVAASDFRIVEQALPVRFVINALGELTLEDFLVLDANLGAGLCADLIARYSGKTRIVFEPVSVEKTIRHAASLHDIVLMTPTEEEMDALEAVDIPRFMTERRIQNILITKGEHGTSLYTSTGRQDFAPTAVIAVRDTTGAGDMLLATLLSLLHRGVGIQEAVRAAMDSVEERLGKGAL